MYWNDIIQLIFSYTYITFSFVQCFCLHNIQNGTTVLSLTDSVFMGYSLSYCTVFMLTEKHKKNSIIHALAQHQFPFNHVPDKESSLSLVPFEKHLNVLWTDFFFL